MVDSRLPEHWLAAPKFFELSDTAWRVFTLALMWCNSQGTDGAIPRLYADRLHPAGAQDAAYVELAAAGIWFATADGFHIPDWDKEMGQSSADYVRERREKNTAKVAAWRASKAAKSQGETGHVTGSVTGYVGEAQAKEKAEAPTEELNENREPSPFCKTHPRGTAEPCVGCMNARQAHDYWMRNRPSPVTRRPRPGDGHECEDNGYGYCGRCEDRMRSEVTHA